MSTISDEQHRGAEVGLHRDQHDRHDDRDEPEREHRAACSATARASWNTRASTRITISLTSSRGWMPMPPMLSQRYVVPWFESRAASAEQARDDQQQRPRCRGRSTRAAPARGSRRPSRRRTPIAPTIIHCTWVSNFAWWLTPRVAEYRFSRPIAHSASIVSDQRPVDRGAEPAPARHADGRARQLEAECPSSASAPGLRRPACRAAAATLGWIFVK